MKGKVKVITGVMALDFSVLENMLYEISKEISECLLAAIDAQGN